ncbi:hypothetical protein [Microcoleus sp.]|uniref:hypothetical protein n=1 Tax=Microcoleus sp. TaxID=44472 RepID=UPI003593051B
MNFQIGDRVYFRFDSALTYRVENVDNKSKKILLRANFLRDYCLAYGWDDVDKYLKAYPMTDG